MSRRAVIAGGGSTLRATVLGAGLVIAAECADAWSAVAAVARESPDVCILEARLPGGALVAAAAIAQATPRPIVLVVDEHGSDALARAAELVGAVYVTSSLHDRSLPRLAQGSLKSPPTAG